MRNKKCHLAIIHEWQLISVSLKSTFIAKQIYGDFEKELGTPGKWWDQIKNCTTEISRVQNLAYGNYSSQPWTTGKITFLHALASFFLPRLGGYHIRRLMAHLNKNLKLFCPFEVTKKIGGQLTPLPKRLTCPKVILSQFWDSHLVLDFYISISWVPSPYWAFLKSWFCTFCWSSGEVVSVKADLL